MPDNIASTQGLREGMLWSKIYHESDLKELALGSQNCNELDNSEISKETHAGSSTKNIVKEISYYHILYYNKILKRFNLMFPRYTTCHIGQIWNL